VVTLFVWLWLIAGGAAFIALFAMMFEKAVFAMVFDDPVMGKGFSAFAGWLAVGVVFGFITTRFTGFNPNGFGPLAIPGVLVGAWFIYRGFRLRGMQDELEAGLHRPPDEETARTFD
jgi:hypothetical protein